MSIELDRALNAAALSGLAIWTMLVALLHGIKAREYNILTDAMSYYAVGDFGSLMTSAFVGFGLAHTALALRLYRQLRLWLAPALLTVVALCLLGSAVFELDPKNTEPQTMHALVHDLLGLFAFVVMAATPLVFAGSLRRVPGYRRLVRASLVFGVGTMSAFLAMPLVFRDLYFGVGQRIFLAVYLGWLVMVALAMARRGVSAREVRPESPPESGIHRRPVSQPRAVRPGRIAGR